MELQLQERIRLTKGDRMDEPVAQSSNTIYDGGGYDLNELKQAEEGLRRQDPKKAAENFVEVDPMYIPVMPGVPVARTEEYEARMVIVEYDEDDNVVGVELL